MKLPTSPSFRLILFLAISGQSVLHAQQNVFSRDNSGTGDWGSGNAPWFYQFSGNQNNPDNNDTIRNDVFIGHNNNLTMSLNNRYYIARDLTFQSGASSSRTLNQTGGGGFSFSRSLINQSNALHTFTAPVAIDGNNAEIRAETGGFSLTSDLFTNGNLFFVRGSGNTSISGVVSQGGSLTKENAGTLTLTGGNTYTGLTTVSGGTLIVSNIAGSGTGTNTVSVASGARLAGTGTIGGVTTVSGTHAVGNGSAGNVGSQNFSNNLTYQTGSMFDWDLTADSTTTGFDKVVGAAGRTVASTGAFRVLSGLSFTTPFWDSQQQWNSVFTGFGTSTGWAANTLVSIFDANGVSRNVANQGSFSISGTTLTWTAVPEPSSLLAGLLMVGGVLRRQRR